jgi:hypothetical protein
MTSGIFFGVIFLSCNMKKITLLLCVCTMVLCAQAQSIIPKIGITLAKVSGDQIEDIESKIGLTVGAAYDFKITGNFSIQPELNFIQKGFRQDFDESFGSEEYSVKSRYTVNYIEIPVMAKVFFGKESMKFFLAAGPSLAIGIGGKFKSEIDFSSSDFNFDETFTGKVKFGDSQDSDEETIYLDNRIDLGLQFGGGVLIANKVMIDLRYGYGLSSLIDGQDDEKLYNRVLQFTVGVPLSIK